MTSGELVVVLVRAQSLSDWLHAYVHLSREGRYSTDRVAGMAHWEAQRLRSSCERALGTRVR